MAELTPILFLVFTVGTVLELGASAVFFRERDYLWFFIFLAMGSVMAVFTLVLGVASFNGI